MANCSILKTVLNSSEVKTAGLIFRIYSNTVGQTAMMWDKTTYFMFYIFNILQQALN